MAPISKVATSQWQKSFQLNGCFQKVWWRIEEYGLKETRLFLAALLLKKNLSNLVDFNPLKIPNLLFI